MAIILPDVTGARRTIDATGEMIFDSFADSVDIRKDWSSSAVAGLSGFAAAGPGIDVRSAVGVRLFDGAGSPAVFLATDGSASFTGSLYVGGVTVIEGDTTIHDDLVVDGTTTIGGTLDVAAAATFSLTLDVTGAASFSSTLDVTGTTDLGGTLTLKANLNADSFEIVGGKFSTPGNGVVIADAQMMLGANTIDYTGTLVAFSDSLSVGGSLSVSSTFTATGTATFNGNVRDSANYGFRKTPRGPMTLNPTGTTAQRLTSIEALLGQASGFGWSSNT